MTEPPIRILLLEDDPDEARLVARQLRRARPAPFEVIPAGRLSEALAILGSQAAPVDLVLADLALPDSTGIDTLDALTTAAPGLPVVALTGNDDDALAFEAVRRGAQDYLVKGAPGGDMLPRVVRYAIERKQAETALRAARNVAEQAARAKSVFLAMMGHEIRTPLNGVLGMARLLLDTPLDHRQRAFAETLVSSGELLLGLVSDILDFARLDAGGLTLESEPFDVIDTVEEVRLVLGSRAAEKGIGLASAFDGGIGRVVLGDRLRLRQILFNLVGNAIKFTDQGRIVLTVEPLPEIEGGQWLRFAVCDTGIGISAEVGANLFTEFWQGESTPARRFAGAGLGLAICKRLATLMGGSIDFDSTAGRGSTFRVDLPLPVVAGGAERMFAVPLSIVRSHRVLLVDDDPVNRAVASGLLDGRGHVVILAADGAEAVRLAATQAPDLVLLDLRMPGMDGIETARAIRTLPGASAQVPIVLLSANPMAAETPDWQAAGIQDCLIKPIRIEAVERLLAGLPTNEPPPADLDLLSLSDLMTDLRDLGAERLLGLVGLFRRSSGADLDALRCAAAESRLDDLAGLAHRMAGAASSLHMRRLAESCRTVEAEARAGDPAACTHAADLAGVWVQSLAHLTDRLDPVPPAAVISRDAEALQYVPSACTFPRPGPA